MIYVGVPNSKRKEAILRRDPSGTVLVRPSDLAWDCDRHIAFLRMVDRVGKAKPMPPSLLVESDYGQYLLTTGRSIESAIHRCRRFMALYAAWKDASAREVWATVTTDGLRLDGSHRAAVALVARHPLVTCAVARYEPEDSYWRTYMGVLRHSKITNG